VRTFPLVLVFFSVVAAKASEPITVYGGKAHAWAIKSDNDAEAQLRKGDLDGAGRSVAEALRRDPSYWPALYTRARIFSRLQKWDLTIRDCTELLRQDSTFALAALLRAQANFALRNYSAARKELDHIVAIQPREQFYALAFNQRAWFRATCPDPSFRDARGAIDDAKKACNITNWREADPIDTLAVAYAATGDFDSAVRYVEKAMQAYDAGEITKILQQQLALFKEHRPIR